MSDIAEAIFCTESVTRVRHQPTIHERFPCCGHLVPLSLKLSVQANTLSGIISDSQSTSQIKIEGIDISFSLFELNKINQQFEYRESQSQYD